MARSCLLFVQPGLNTTTPPTKLDNLQPPEEGGSALLDGGPIPSVRSINSSPFTSGIELDTTLEKLYRNSKADHATIALVASYPPPMGERDSRKYVYNDSKGSDTQEAQRALGMQKFAFCAGGMPVVVSEEHLAGRSSIVEAETHIRSVLVQEQWPTMMSIEALEALENSTAVRLAMRLPLDEFERFSPVVDPEAHYMLLSKQALAGSGLKTPRTTVFELATDKPGLHLRYHAIRNEYHDLRPLSRADWAPTILREIEERPLPFVFKLQQTIFSRGTWIVKDEAKRWDLRGEMELMVHHLAAYTNGANHLLKPASVCISDFVHTAKDEQNGTAITGFIHRDGTVDFLSAVKQTMGESHIWAGGRISYSAQVDLAARFAGTLQAVCRYVNSVGYCGCIGIDVLEDAEGVQWVIDLNLRPPGSLVLGLLRGHFARCGCNYAELISSLHVGIGKIAFIEAHRRELDAGHMIMTAWVPDSGADASAGSAGVVLGAEDEKSLEGLVKKVPQVASGMSSAY